MKTPLIAVLSIVLSVTAQFLLKAGMSGDGVKKLLVQPNSISGLLYILIDKYILGGFLLYGLGAMFWLSVLSKWDVSKAYPLVGLGFVFSVVIGYLLGEDTNFPRVIGVALICAGVFLVGRS